METPYTPAKFKEDAFNCVHCGAFSDQSWGKPHFSGGKYQYGQIERYWSCRCSHCRGFSFWVDGKLVFPDINTAPKPNPDLPSDILADFEEARTILSRSPRGAAALLRLCIQKLCKYLGESGTNINN